MLVGIADFAISLVDRTRRSATEKGYTHLEFSEQFWIAILKEGYRIEPNVSAPGTAVLWL
jgi:hypothetical protein